MKCCNEELIQKDCIQTMCPHCGKMHVWKPEELNRVLEMETEAIEEYYKGETEASPVD